MNGLDFLLKKFLKIKKQYKYYFIISIIDVVFMKGKKIIFMYYVMLNMFQGLLVDIMI